MSGKTTLAKKLALKASLKRNVIVLDPLKDPDWFKNGVKHVTDSLQEFLVLAKKNKNLTLIIDEAGTFCGQYNSESWWLATQARHWGHQSIFISQRANMVAKNVRDNCSKLFCFKISHDDSKLLHNDFCCNEILETPSYMQGDFLYCPRFEKPEKLNIFV